MYSDCDRCIKMSQCELSVTSLLLQANLFAVRSQTNVSLKLSSFCLLRNINNILLCLNTTIQVYCAGQLPNYFSEKLVQMHLSMACVLTEAVSHFQFLLLVVLCVQFSQQSLDRLQCNFYAFMVNVILPAAS